MPVDHVLVHDVKVDEVAVFLAVWLSGTSANTLLDLNLGLATLQVDDCPHSLDVRTGCDAGCPNQDRELLTVESLDQLGGIRIPELGVNLASVSLGLDTAVLRVQMLLTRMVG